MGFRGRMECLCPPQIYMFKLFKDFIYLFLRHRGGQGRDTGRGRSRLHAGSLTRDSIPGLQDHTPGCRAVLNHCATGAAPKTSSFIHSFIHDRHREREREAETQAEGEAGSMHREPDVGPDPGSPGSRPGPKAGAKPLRHPGIPQHCILNRN